jgi:hypothetical protein
MFNISSILECGERVQYKDDKRFFSLSFAIDLDQYERSAKEILQKKRNDNFD